MHRLASLFIALILFVATGAGQLQQTMVPQYAAYVSYSYDDTNNLLYQTVLVDGTTTGGCTQTITVVCGPNGQTCTYQFTHQSCLTAVHTPTITNQLGNAGGTSTGPSVNPFSYLSYQTTTSLPVDPNGGQVQAYAFGQVRLPRFGSLSCLDTDQRLG